MLLIRSPLVSLNTVLMIPFVFILMVTFIYRCLATCIFLHGAPTQGIPRDKEK